MIQEDNKIANANMEIHFGGVYVGDNIFKVIVHNLLKKSLKLKLKLNKNGVENVKEISSDDTLFSEKINYNIYGRNALNFGFSAKLLEKDKTIIQKEHSFYVVPFAKDIADIKKKLAEIKATISEVPNSNQYAADRLIVFSYRLHEIEEKIDVAGTLPLLELSELKNSVFLLRKEVSGFSKMSLASQDAEDGFAVYSANPWAPFGGVDEITENRMKKAEVSIEVLWARLSRQQLILLILRTNR